MNKNRKKIYAILGIVTLLVITISISYAYFTANLIGEEATTISVGGGSLKIVYNGGSNIVVSNIFPQDNAVAVKTFTVTGTNTTDLNMEYYLYLVVDENEFSDNSIRYKLISTNTDGNGNVAPSITEMQNIMQGTNEAYDLGRGEFIGATSGDKVHTYKLEIYFPNEDFPQNDEQGSTIKMHVEISGTPKQTKPLLTDLILAQGIDAATIEAKGNPNFAAIATATDTGLYATEDEYGTSYYYRGLKDNLNNNLIFGGFQWKIVRINGDGSIRIMYNGLCPNDSCTINSTGEETQIVGTYAWNTINSNDNKYAGYMYGGTNGATSTSRITDMENVDYTVSTNATYNETNVYAKTQLDNWYESNIENQGIDITSKIADNIFCNDRQTTTVTTLIDNEGGYGISMNYYGAYYRLFTNKIPTLKCTNKNDRFTVSDVSLGNGALTYPVGIISADESLIAGLIKSANSTNYLYTNQPYWTLSPYRFIGGAILWQVASNGSLSDNSISSELGLRPLLNLNSNITITSGDGSTMTPFIVS